MNCDEKEREAPDAAAQRIVAAVFKKHGNELLRELRQLRAAVDGTTKEPK